MFHHVYADLMALAVHSTVEVNLGYECPLFRAGCVPRRSLDRTTDNEM